MEGEGVYLSFKSICLRKSDVDCFDDFRFLNDLCISFFYELLNENYKNFDKYFFLFDPASVSTMVIYDEMEDLIDMFGGLNLEDKDYLFIPINDNTDKYAMGGGDHWALIIYQKSDDTFYYLDSMLNYIKNTTIVTQKLKQILTNTQSKPIVNVNNTLIEKCQSNTYDCGMFVLSFTEAILDYIFKADENITNNKKLNSEIINKIIKESVYQNKMKSKRKEILQTIDNLKKSK